MPRKRITEYLDVDLDTLTWHCNRCGQALCDVDKNYKEGCRVYARDPRTVHDPVIEGEWTFAPDPELVLILEYYCPSCAAMITNEYLPPGHPITHDIEVDIDALKRKAAEEGGERA